MIGLKFLAEIYYRCLILSIKVVGAGKNVGHMTFWYFPDQSVKYTMILPTGTKDLLKALDLKFSPEVDNGNTR